jgi:hypothetical protein
MRTEMGRMTRAAIGGLLAVALAGCSSASGGDVAGADAAPSPSQDAGDGFGTTHASPTAPAEVTEFSDTFDDDRNGWALPPTEQASSEMIAGDFVIETKVPLHPHLSAATLAEAYDQGRLAMTDVVIRATVTRESGEAALGVYCREVPDNDGDWQWYEFIVRDGYAAIRHADFAGHIDVLAHTAAVQVALSQGAELEATCLDGPGGTAALTLSVDGRSVLATKVDDPLGNGAPGVQSYDPSDLSEGSRILWHDFSVEPA